MPSIKKNFLYNSILTSANYIFPLIIFPYVSRVLGVNNIGICNYVDSIIQNFILLSTLGIGVVGIREIVAAKDDRIKLNKVFSTIFFINAVLTLLMVVVLTIMTLLFEDFRQYKDLMFIGILKLLGSFLLIEWFFKGLEDFKYITLRTIIVRATYIGAVFVFVKSPDDYEIYFILTCGSVLVNAIFNLIYSHRFVSLTTHIDNLMAYLKPISILGFYLILTNTYLTFNTTWLGIVAGAKEVGYFTTATKLYTILLAMFTAFTTVMLPHMSDCLKHNDIAKFKDMLSKSMNILYAFVIPIACFGFIFASDIVMFIAGPGYEGAVIPMQLCMPLMLIVGYEQIIIIQGLMPLKKDKAILINSICGATVAIVLCLTIVANLKAIGSAIVWIASELAVTISASIFVKKYLRISFPWKEITKNIFYNLPLILLMVLIHQVPLYSPFQMLLFGGIVLMLYVFVLQYSILKQALFVNFINKYIRRSNN